MKRFRRLTGTPGTQIVSLHVLPGHQGSRWLVSLATTHGHPGKFTIKCWDIRPPNPIFVAQREFNSLAGIAVNRSTSDAGCIAVLVPKYVIFTLSENEYMVYNGKYTSGIEILSLDLNASHPNHCFFTSKRIPIAMASVLRFQGRRLIVKDSQQRLFLLNIDYPQTRIEFQHNKAVSIPALSPIVWLFIPSLVIIDAHRFCAHGHFRSNSQN